MRLICIRECEGRIPPQLNHFMVIKGEEYESVGSEVNEGGLFFYLAGMPDFCVYHSDLFAILPDKSADEMSQESKEAIINIEQPINA